MGGLPAAAWGLVSTQHARHFLGGRMRVWGDMNYLVRDASWRNTIVEFSLKQQGTAHLQVIAKFSITGLISLLK